MAGSGGGTASVVYTGRQSSRALRGTWLARERSSASARLFFDFFGIEPSIAPVLGGTSRCAGESAAYQVERQDEDATDAGDAAAYA